MSLANKFIAYFNELKIIRKNTNDLSMKDINETLQLINETIEPNNQDEAIKFLEILLTENPEIEIIKFCLAVINFIGNHGQGDFYLEKFFYSLKNVKKKSLIINICQELEKDYSSVLIWKYLVDDLKETDSNEINRLEGLLIKIFKNQVDDYKTAVRIGDLLLNTKPDISLRYYQTAIEQLLKSNNHDEVLNVWKKVVRLNSDYDKEIVEILKKISPKIKQEQKVNLFIDFFKKKEISYELNLIIFKLSLVNQVFIEKQFDQIVKTWNNLYEDKLGYRLFLNLSTLSKVINRQQPLVNINFQKLLQQIEDFEKYINLDVDQTVEHRNYGLGVIKKLTYPSHPIKPNEVNVNLIIDFIGKKNHQMSIRIASKSLEIVSKSHLKSLKLFYPEKFQILLEEQSVQFLKNILQFVNKPVSYKQIESLVVPDLLDKKEWHSQWDKIKTLLPDDLEIGFKNNQYFLKKNSTLFEQSILEKLKDTSDQEEKIKIIEDYLIHNSNKSNQVDKEIEEIKKNIEDLILNHEVGLKLSYSLGSLYQRLGEQNPAVVDKIKHMISSSVDEDLIYSYHTLRHQSSKSFFLKFMQEKLSDDKFLNCIFTLIANQGTSNKEFILDYCLTNLGNLFVKKIFDVIEKEYLTCLDSFAILAKLFFKKDKMIYSGNKLTLFKKLIRSLSESHKKIEMDLDRSNSRKAFNIIHKLCFEEKILFKVLLDSSLNISTEEKKLIIEKLINEPYIDKKIKTDLQNFTNTHFENIK